MKLNEIQIYKGIGSIQYVNDEYEGRVYVYRHFYTGESSWEETIKGAKEMLDWEEKQAVDVRAAIEVLTRKGYRIFKEVA